ncbi:helix-turn-helix domain-containing protein [Paenibacillus silvisoli]|uniref:helix-turn-helix domain-containing protein n=1 Tax=Paenibacillus silvisoli TaxID=3110539 RepID=UPI002805464E|nr:helix-turn-helix domain-containing protein [Paenibacillus silvisoli]
MRLRGLYLIKLVLSCLLIAVFCGGVASIYYYIESNQLMNKELKQRHEGMLEQVRDNIDFKLENAIQSIFTLKSSSELLNYSRSDGEDAYVNTQVYNRLRAHFAVFSRLGYEIDVLRRGAQTVITPENTVGVDNYLAERGLDANVVLQKLSAMTISQTLNVYSLQSFKTESKASGDDEVNLVFMLKENGVVNVYYFVSFKNTTLFPQGGNDSYSLSIGDEQLVSKGPWSAADAGSVSSNTYALASKRLPEWKVSYLPEVPVSSAEEKQLKTKSVLVALITIVVGAVFAIMIAYMTYRPVRRTLRQVIGDSLNEQSSIADSQDEFGMIRNITSTIRRSNQELSTELHRYREPLRGKLLRDLITGVLSKDDAAKQLQQMNMKHLLEVPVCVALLHLSDEYGGFMIDPQIIEGLETLIGSEIEGAPGTEWVKIDANRQALLLFEPDDIDVPAMLQRIIHEVHRAYPIRLTIALGGKEDSVEDAVMSYHSALRVMEQLMPMNRKHLLTEQDLEKAGVTGFYYPLDLEKNLINAAVSGNEHEVRHILQSLVSRFDFDHIDRSSFHQFMYAMQSTVYRIAQQLNSSMEELFQEDAPIKQLEQCQSSEQLIDSLMLVFVQVFEMAEQKSKSLDHLLTDSMLQFVHTQYVRDISLQDLAQHVKMSPNYISFMFKANVGQNFKDYLNSYRVAQAKLLMEEGGYTVNDIAARVGCNNTNTFIRIFKKEEGLSPGQFIARKFRQAE